MNSTTPPTGSSDELAPRRPMTAARLRVVRQWLGIDVEALAEILGINVRNLRKYETGASVMNPAVAVRLEGLVQRADEEVDALLAALDGQDAPAVTTYRESPDLWAARPELRPLPIGWHRAVIARVLDELPDVDVDYPLEQAP